ncbi:ATP-binding cassette domain-containing protein, partial [Nocardia brasiliensis]|uniref:ATP-binding cassette domain-containing protein n=1 Tax=Nocardia brasiliensis TaxID=37326 RepID=UPI003D78DFFC
MTVLADADVRHRVTLTGVSKSYPGDDGPTQVLAPTDLTIESGEFVCVVGPSGCGKSTLLNLIAGFLEPSEGTVRVGDRPVTRPDPHRGRVMPQPHHNPRRTVIDVIRPILWPEEVQLLRWCSAMSTRWANMRVRVTSGNGGLIET